MNRTEAMTAEHNELIKQIESRIAYGRKQVLKAEDEGRPTERYTAYIIEQKEELAKAKGQWNDKFTIEFKNMGKDGTKSSSWYTVTAKYGYKMIQDSLHKSQEGRWWSAGSPCEYKTINELKKAVESTYRNYFGI